MTADGLRLIEQVVIAGAGHAAGQAVASLKQKKFAGRIVLIGEEPWYPYQRPPLSKKYLAGEMPAERLYFKPESFYDDPDIEVLLNTTVTAINRDERHVSTADGREVPYDNLVLALGARPIKISVPGAESRFVQYLRNVNDVDQIQALLAENRQVVVVGAGYIGLEVAAVCAKLGHDVTVLEMQDRVMSRVVSPQVAEFFEAEHRRNGVKLRLSTAIDSVTETDGRAVVHASDGEALPADLVVVGIGVTPNSELAAAAGINVENGICVDDRCYTSDPRILAIGDCTFHPNSLLGKRLRLESVHNALEQAKTAAANIVGEDCHYAQVPWFWSDQFDLKLQIAGLSQGYDKTIIRGKPADRSFACLYLQKGVLIAIDAVNRPRDFMQSKSLIAAKARIDPAILADENIALKDMPA